MFNKIKTTFTKAKLKAMSNVAAALAVDRSAASLWEYLLVIAIVCIIGAALINVIIGSNGIANLWNSLYGRFSDIVNQAM